MSDTIDMKIEKFLRNSQRLSSAFKSFKGSNHDYETIRALSAQVLEFMISSENIVHVPSENDSSESDIARKEFDSETKMFETIAMMQSLPDKMDYEDMYAFLFSSKTPHIIPDLRYDIVAALKHDFGNYCTAVNLGKELSGKWNLKKRLRHAHAIGKAIEYTVLSARDEFGMNLSDPGNMHMSELYSDICHAVHAVNSKTDRWMSATITRKYLSSNYISVTHAANLYRIFHNMFRNKAKLTSDNINITIDIAETYSYYAFVIKDDTETKISDKFNDPSEVFELGKSDLGGTGKGLYAAKKLVEEKFHGKIEVTRDAVFTMYLPKDNFY